MERSLEGKELGRVFVERELVSVAGQDAIRAADF
jgi:hypothetical protein